MPARDPQGFTPEEAAEVEARAQEIYARLRSQDIEQAAQKRARQLYQAMLGVAPPEANAVPDAG